MNKFRIMSVFVVLAMLFSFANVSPVAAIPAPAGSYTLTDLGALYDGSSQARDINEAGQVVGNSSTVGGFNHAYLWENGALTDLGTFGGNSSIPSDINNAGQVVGYSHTAGDEQHAFFWDNGVMTDLGTFGGRNSYANAVNEAGQVVGSAQVVGGQDHPFVWQNGVMTDLGTLGGNDGQATDINDTGQVVGYADTGNAEPHAFLWDEETMIDLGTLGGGQSRAIAINDAGQIIGSSTTANGEDRAFLWENGVMTDLGTWNNGTSDATDIRAIAINDAGQVIVEASFGRRDPGIALLWENGVMTDLGNLGGTRFGVRVTAINNDGQVVGSADTTEGDLHAFVWEDGVMTDLGTFNDSFTGATAINNAGQVIGYYTGRVGQDRAFLANMAGVAPNTPAGSNVSVQPVDATGGTTPVTLTFAQITQAGTTSLVTSNTGILPPAGLQLGNPPLYYDLSTTAVFDGPIILCIDYTGTSFTNESNIKLHHYENDAWVDRTISLDTDANIICASVPSLSPFAIFEPENIAPTAVAGGPYLVAVNASVAFDGSASSDPDGDTLTETWTAAGGTVAGATYTAGAVPGIYDVCLTVNDGTVDSAPSCTMVVVYDPSGGFVTGGGWIDSPVNANYQYMQVGGKATFGFVAKYKKGANVPDGNTQFQFKAGDLNFQSASYEWLVVAGDKAQFKGEGTINGEGSYKFMITADDGSPDTFRIKIWYEENGAEVVVYDNGSQQSLGGGSIKVHK